MSKPLFWKKRKYFKMSSAEILPSMLSVNEFRLGNRHVHFFFFFFFFFFCIPDWLSVRSSSDDRQPAHNMLYTLYMELIVTLVEL